MLPVILITVQALACLVIFLSFWSLLPRNEWWVRGTDFPRLQILFVGFVCLLGLALLPHVWDMYFIVLTALLVMAISYQLKMVLPYTILWRKQVQQVKLEDKSKQISLLVSNVLTPNDQYQQLIKQVEHYQPDIVLTLESDRHWEQALSVIEADYPHVVRIPLDNLYGMHLYSRLKLRDTEVKFLLSDEIPSIHTMVCLPCGKEVDLYCLHPKPPSPTEAYESTLRDAELLLVGKEVEQLDRSCIVMGDLNDVAWSRTTRLFQRISGLLDPRVGRQFINTFHADYPFLRWSLDHLFHSPDFGMVQIQRGHHIGSDHFPVFTKLQYMPQWEQAQDQIEADQDDIEEAQDRIDDGYEKAEQQNQPA